MVQNPLAHINAALFNRFTLIAVSTSRKKPSRHILISRSVKICSDGAFAFIFALRQPLFSGRSPMGS